MHINGMENLTTNVKKDCGELLCKMVAFTVKRLATPARRLAPVRLKRTLRILAIRVHEVLD